MARRLTAIDHTGVEEVVLDTQQTRPCMAYTYREYLSVHIPIYTCTDMANSACITSNPTASPWHASPELPHVSPSNKFSVFHKWYSP